MNRLDQNTSCAYQHTIRTSHQITTITELEDGTLCHSHSRIDEQIVLKASESSPDTPWYLDPSIMIPLLFETIILGIGLTLN